MEGHALVKFFKKLGIDTRGIRTDASWRTPTKTRILAGAVHSQRQQIVRLDSGGPLKKTSPLRVKLPKCDALLVSDYGYGWITPELVASLRPDNIPVTVDSRFTMESFTNMTAATPNEPEVEAALGITIGNNMEKLESAGRTLLRRLKHQALVITRGKDGMALFERGKKTEHIPVHGSDEVADVTGAGDTVIATFTLALSAGATFSEAAKLANYAGGIVVMKHGTRPVLFEELRKVVEGNVQ
jgi:rfaE bifunctional protein kinase chain/domain